VERRKAFSVIASGAALLALAGCDAEDKPSATATVLNNENVHEAMKSVEEALDSLESNVDDFSTTNWKEVVPEVEVSVADLRQSLNQLKKELGYSD